MCVCVCVCACVCDGMLVCVSMHIYMCVCVRACVCFLGMKEESSLPHL